MHGRGWRVVLALTVMLALATAGCSGCRGEAPFNSGPVGEVKPITGEMVFVPASTESNQALEHWLYIDGQLVAQQGKKRDDPAALQEFRIALAPMRYHVEIALARTNDAAGTDFPFRFVGADVVVEAGRTLNHRFDVTPNPYESLMQRAAGIAEGQTWEGFLDSTAKDAEAHAKAYDQDAAARAMRNVYDALTASPPFLPAVTIAFPEEMGGARQYNADQVRRLVRWLKGYHWDYWYPPSLQSFGRKWPDDIPAALQARLTQIDNYVQAKRAEVERLNEIAPMLEKAGASNK